MVDIKVVGLNDEEKKYEKKIKYRNRQLGSYKALLQQKNKEIERLNKGYCQFKKECGNVADCMREEYFQMQHRNMLMSLENDRLNNIINEFDRYIDEIIDERIEKIEGTRFLKGGFTIEQNYLRRRLHERLQELKNNKEFVPINKPTLTTSSTSGNRRRWYKSQTRSSDK